MPYKKKSPFSFKTLLRFSKPFSCSKLLLYLIYPESILAKELIGFCFKSCWVLKHGSLQMSFGQDISFWLVKSCSQFPHIQLAGPCALTSFDDHLSITEVSLVSDRVGCCIFWVTEPSRSLSAEVSYQPSGTQQNPWSKHSLLGAILPSRKNWAMSGDIFGCHSWKRGLWHLEGWGQSCWRFRMHRQPLTANNDPSHNVSSEETEAGSGGLSLQVCTRYPHAHSVS